jgi:hypothetical protein
MELSQARHVAMSWRQQAQQQQQQQRQQPPAVAAEQLAALGRAGAKKLNVQKGRDRSADDPAHEYEMRRSK